MKKTSETIRNILELNGFQVYEYYSKVRNLLGNYITYRNILGVLEGKCKVHWKYSELNNISEINIAIYNIDNTLIDNLLDSLEKEGVISEIIDNNVYGKLRCRGEASITKIKRLVNLLKGINSERK